jgi:hypothetical protein
LEGKQAICGNLKREGELTQAGFIYKAMKMGFTVLSPFGDSERYDYVLYRNRKFWHVQVRSTYTMSPWKIYSVASHFKIRHGKSAPTQHLHYTKREIDILVVYVVP